MKLYKVRIQCIDFEDIVVEANSEKEAENIAFNQSNFSGKEFCEFLDIEQDDIEEWEKWG